MTNRNTTVVPRGRSVALALSGGVDSAVSAKLLVDSGAEVTCYYMSCWSEVEGCEAVADYQSACRVASFLKLPLYKLDYVEAYRKGVFDYMVRMLEDGLTPNPDIGCNSEIKFGIYYKDMVSKGFDFISTGHYASVKTSSIFGNRISIPKDLNKDQSYYLSQISPEVDNSKLLFPLEKYLKSEVRELAKRYGLPNAERSDSQGICFIGDIQYREFINNYVKSPRGEVVDSSGRVIGTHLGLHIYTVGQRHGFNINKYTSAPLYVIKKNKDLNQLVVGQRDEAYYSSIKLTGIISYIKDLKILQELPSQGLKVRIRSLGELVEVEKVSMKGQSLTVYLKRPIYAPSPGQVGVFYFNDMIILSGTIH